MMWDILYVIDVLITLCLKYYLIRIASRYLQGGRWPQFQLTNRRR